MKKSTGIVFLLAVALAAVAYFYDWKRHPTVELVDPNAVQLAFTIKPEDINHIKLTRMGTTVVMDLKDDGWHITQPISAAADQGALDDLTHSLAALPSDRKVSATPEQLKDYGLTDPSVVLEFTLVNGEAHKLVLGGKDFSNLEVYSQIDNGKDVTLIVNKIVASADKPLEDFRDHSVLLVQRDDVTSFDLHNKSGEITAARDGLSWNILKPVRTPSDLRATAAVIDAVIATKITKFVSDDPKDLTPANLAKYGLDSPSIRLHVNMTGGKSAELLLGKKDGLEYYAMDRSRSMIFRVPDTLYAKLDRTLSDLHAHVLLTGREDEITRVEVHGQKTSTVCVRSDAGSLIIEPGTGQKNSEPTGCPDFLAPLERARATKVYDQPSEEMKAMLAKPAVLVTLTIQPSNPPGAPEGPEAPPKKTEVQISAISGNSVYARTSNGPTIYEFDKHAFDVLNSNPPAPAK